MSAPPNSDFGAALEKADRRIEDELRDTIDTIPALVWSTLPDGSLEFLNQRWLEYTGLSLEDGIGRGWESVVHPDDLAEYIAHRTASLNSGQPREGEIRVRRADGEYRWWFVRTVPLRDGLGKIVKWYGTGLDIEDRKRAEEELSKTIAERARLAAFREDVGTALAHQGQLRGILQSCAEAMVRHLDAALARIWIASGDARELELHASAGIYTHLNGFHSRIAVGDLKIGLIAQERTPHLTNDVQNDPRVTDKEWARREALASFAGCPLIAEGRVVGVMAMFSKEPLGDSTIHSLLVAADGIAQAVERKHAEGALQRSEAYMAEAQRLTHTGSWAWNPLTRENTYWSAEHYRILGLDPTRDSASFSAVLRRMPLEDRVRFEKVVEEAIRGKADFEVDWRVQLAGGSIRHLHSVGHPVLDAAGDLLEMIGTCMDVTDQRNAQDTLSKAFEEIKVLRDRLYRENLALRDEIDRTSMFEEIVGASTALHNVLSRVTKVAPTDSTVLITGESGTGKELIARAIHKMSKRSGRAFVSVNCAALAPSLISSELFGHEKGAFTGAVQRRLGRFELADGGTIFLDEAGELPPDTQVALLRVLQERELERVGGTQSIKVDVRVIAATNRDLKAAAAQRTFRQDLFYRLNVFPIEMPPLRERKDDILLLVEYFVRRYASRAAKDIRSIDKKTLQLFQNYDWPGNIRELQNVVERSVILNSGEVFSVDASWLSRESSPPARPASDSTPLEGVSPGEREAIEAALADSRGRVAGPAGAAAKLRIPPSTLESRIRALKIQKSQFKFR